MNQDNPRHDLFNKFAELRKAGSILDALERELRSQGFTGSTDVPKLIFLCLTTRYFQKPVSLIIKGPSGSGKSHAMHAGLQFVPSTAYQSFSGMSEKALMYSGLNLKHRYLVIGEAAGLAQGDGRAYLRQFLSEGRVDYITVQSTKDGLKGQVLPPIEGPGGLIMTTTANALHPEDESRMLSYQLDESSERIRDTLMAQAKGLGTTPKVIDTEAWYALHEYVGAGSLEVDFPYAEQLAAKLPVTHYRVMRDFPHILSLIKSHALMHDFWRGRDSDDRVMATIDDYRAVYDLIEEPLSQGLEGAVSSTMRNLIQAVQKLSPKESDRVPWEGGVSQVELAKELKRDQSVVSRNIRKAVGQGFLKDLNPGQGRKAQVVIGDRELPSGSVLPHPDELEPNMLLKAA